MRIASAPSHGVKIYIAGSHEDALRICREYCFDVGYCVTVTKTSYVYKGGTEEGVIIGLINYPRFPRSPSGMEASAIEIGKCLMTGLFQTSFSVEASANTTWYSRREEA